MKGRDNTHGVNYIGPPLVLLVLLKVLIFLTAQMVYVFSPCLFYYQSGILTF